MSKAKSAFKIAGAVATTGAGMAFMTAAMGAGSPGCPEADGNIIMRGLMTGTALLLCSYVGANISLMAGMILHRKNKIEDMPYGTPIYLAIGIMAGLAQGGYIAKEKIWAEDSSACKPEQSSYVIQDARPAQVAVNNISLQEYKRAL